MLKDGSQTVTANLPMSAFKLTGLGAGTTAGDSVRYEQAVTAVAITGGTITGVPVANIPVNSQSAAYPLVIGDAGKFILHPTADNNPRTFTIPANGSVAYAIGTVLTFVNQINTLTIAITTDTLTLAGTSSTGSRTLSANGLATAIKADSTNWIISGTGIS